MHLNTTLPHSTESSSYSKTPFRFKDADFTTIENHFSTFNKGLCVNGTHHMTEKESFEHMLLVGASGVGKSTKIFIKTLATIDGSIIINDPHKEIHAIMRQDLLRRGYTIHVLDFSNPQAGYNPLIHLEEKDIPLMARLLVRAGHTPSSGEIHWLDKAAELIECIIHLVIRMESDNANLTDVLLQLLDAKNNPKETLATFREYASQLYTAKFQAMTSDRTNELSGIFSTAIRALNDFGNETISEVTSKNDIFPQALRLEKTAIFIQTDPNRKFLYNKIISIFFEQMSLYTMQSKAEGEQDIFYLFDEFASLYLPNLPDLIAEARKFNISYLLSIQSLGQLEKKYKGDYRVITDNCKTTVFLGHQQNETAHYLERILGNTYAGGESFAPVHKLRTMGKEEALILTGGVRPILAETLPYYRNPELCYLLQEDNGEQQTLSPYTQNALEMESKSIIEQ